VIIGGAGFLLAQPATGSGSGQTSTLANVPSVKLAIFIVIEILILSTYFIDRVHQIWLVAAVERAKSLETLLGYKITGNLNSKVAGLSAVSIGPALYGLLLFLAWVIFWVSFATFQVGLAHRQCPRSRAYSVLCLSLGSGGEDAESQSEIIEKGLGRKR
jgi:hypothetical protein